MSTQKCTDTQTCWVSIDSLNILSGPKQVVSLEYIDSNSLFIVGKTLYPKKQFHSSPSWFCLHLSGTTPPQYLMGQMIRADINDLAISSRY